MITSINEWRKFKLNEDNSTITAFKKLPEGMFFIVTRAEKRVTKDSYEHGEDPDTTQTHDMTSEAQGNYTSVQELAENLSISNDHNSWIIMDDRLLCQVMEDEDGSEVDKNSPTFAQFKAGEIDLYASEFDFHIEIVLKKEFSSEELSTMLGVKNYD